MHVYSAALGGRGLSQVPGQPGLRSENKQEEQE